MSQLELRRHRDRDIDAILCLHAHSFGIQPRTRAYWEWLDQEALCAAVAMTRAGECVGMYASVKKRFWLEGREQVAHLCMDVAIAETWRQGIAAGRLMVQDGRLVFGFPQPPLLRVVTGHLGFQVLGDVLFLLRDVAVGTASPPAEFEVARLGEVAAEVDRLWDACKPQFGCSIVRDAAHWRHRFLHHPTVDYTVLAAREAGTGVLRGLAAVRSGGLHDDVLSIVDWLAVEGDDAAATALLAAAVAVARERQRRAVLAWFRPFTAAFAQLQRRHGFHVVGSPYQVVYLPFSSRLSRAELAGQWHLTMADMDFV
jgi:hypothetical protein